MHKIFITSDAQEDLDEIYRFIFLNDLPEKADYVLEKIESSIKSLGEYPERGTYPNELLELGIKEYREVFFKPYRIIYRIKGDDVYIMLVSDGRRDMQTLLSKRLLTGRT